MPNEPNNQFPEEFPIRPAQADYLKKVYNRLHSFETQVIPKIQELRAAYQEAMFFVRKDLGVPYGPGIPAYVIAEDLSKFEIVKPEVNEAQPAQKEETNSVEEKQ